MAFKYTNKYGHPVLSYAERVAARRATAFMFSEEQRHRLEEMNEAEKDTEVVVGNVIYYSEDAIRINKAEALGCNHDNPTIALQQIYRLAEKRLCKCPDCGQWLIWAEGLQKWEPVPFSSGYSR